MDLGGHTRCYCMSQENGAQQKFFVRNRAPSRDRVQSHGSSAGSTARLRDVGAQRDTPLKERVVEPEELKGRTGDKPLLKERGGKGCAKSAGFHTNQATTPRWTPPPERRARAARSSPSLLKPRKGSACRRHRRSTSSQKSSPSPPRSPRVSQSASNRSAAHPVPELGRCGH